MTKMKDTQLDNADECVTTEARMLSREKIEK